MKNIKRLQTILAVLVGINTIAILGLGGSLELNVLSIPKFLGYFTLAIAYEVVLMYLLKTLDKVREELILRKTQNIEKESAIIMNLQNQLKQYQDTARFDHYQDLRKSL